MINTSGLTPSCGNRMGSWFLIVLFSLTCLLDRVEAQLWSPEIDLNEKIWLDWDASDLPLGDVASWADAAGGVVASQSTSSARPVKTSEGVVFGGGTSNLWGPNFSEPGRTHRAAVMIFKADISTASAEGGSFFSANGYQGSSSNRVPMLGYWAATDQFTASWANVPGAGLKLPAGNADDWHVLISRRVGGKHYASIDGQPELVATVDNLVLGRDSVHAPSIIGDYQSNSIDWTLNRLMILQDELQDNEVDNIAGWAMWEMGMQDNLPADHPYRTAPPQSDPYVNPYVGNTLGDWSEIRSWWDDTNLGQEKEQHYGEPIRARLAGFTNVFEDHFTSMSVTDERWGTGPWYAPVHSAATGAARGQGPNSSPYVYSQDGSEITITMKQSGANWYSGVFTSVNLDGRGNTWNPAEHPTYFEVRMKATAGNDRGAWPAFWLKDVNEFFMRTVPRTEIDIYEGYNSDPDGHHQAYHNHPAARHYGDRLDTHQVAGNYTGLSSSWPDAPVDLFDGEYHTYGALIDSEWLIFTFDGLELMRAPVRPDMLRDLFILVDLALLPSEASQASGEYELTIDYIRVLQDLQEVAIPGDFNNDGTVDMLDLNEWEIRYANGQADELTGADFLIWQQHLGESASLLGAVPEPASGCLSLLAAVSLGMRRNKRAFNGQAA